MLPAPTPAGLRSIQSHTRAVRQRHRDTCPQKSAACKRRAQRSSRATVGGCDLVRQAPSGMKDQSGCDVTCAARSATATAKHQPRNGQDCYSSKYFGYFDCNGFGTIAVYVESHGAAGDVVRADMNGFVPGSA